MDAELASADCLPYCLDGRGIGDKIELPDDETTINIPFKSLPVKMSIVI